MISNQRGTTELTLLMVAMLLILGVLGCDFSRAFSVQARLQTAVDAATLAACNEAELKGTRVEEMWDSSGNPTDDPEQATKIVSKWVQKWADLSDRETRANAAARTAFVKNINGEYAPIRKINHDVAPACSCMNDSGVAAGYLLFLFTIRSFSFRFVDHGTSSISCLDAPDTV
jgi:hypothetical protein